MVGVCWSMEYLLEYVGGPLLDELLVWFTKPPIQCSYS